MINDPAVGADGKRRKFCLLSLSPSPTPEPLSVAGVAGAAGWGACVGVSERMKVAPVTAGVSTGEVTITGTLRPTGAMKITGTLRATRLFRFELFFLANTPTCKVNSIRITDIAMINVRTGLTIFDSPFATATVPTLPYGSGLDLVFQTNHPAITGVVGWKKVGQHIT
jgi:hypothetical protein